jgi:hypothetical protein
MLDVFCRENDFRSIDIKKTISEVILERSSAAEIYHDVSCRIAVISDLYRVRVFGKYKIITSLYSMASVMILSQIGFLYERAMEN